MYKIFLFLLLMLIIFEDVNGFGLFPVGRTRMGKANHGSTWNSNGFGKSYKYQYSLQWDEETCRTATGHDIGYVKTPSMNPENSDGFFNPGITTSQGYWYWDLWNGTACRATTSDNFTSATRVINNNKAFCASLGLGGIERTCFATRKAPSSKRELYRWLADIDYAFSGEKSQNDENLKKVRNGEEDALNAGYKDFKHIKMQWIRDIDLANDENVLKKYIASFPGQDMVCARVRGAATSASNPACSESEKCLSLDSLHLIIKCLPVPVGPPPNPFTPFIIGKEVIYSVPVGGMQYTKPEVRIVYFENNIKTIATKNNLSEGQNILNGSRYTFRIDVVNDSICSFVTHIKNAAIASPYPIGCQDRGIAPKPDIESRSPIIASGKVSRKLSGKISYPWITLATLRPTSLDELKSPTSLVEEQDVHINDKYGNITIFQGGFNRNPERRKIDLKYLEKKMCSSGVENAQVVEYISIDKDCADITLMVKAKDIDIYKCTNVGSEEVFVKDTNDCTRLNLNHDGNPAVKGNQCYDDTFMPVSKKCRDISSNIVHEHDDDGQKLCMRNWNGGEKRYTILRKNASNPSAVDRIKIVEANHALMPLDVDGEVDFTKTPVSFSNFSQDDLDYLRRLDDSHYWHKNADNGIDVRYYYGPKLFQNGDSITSYMNIDTGQPIFLTESDELLEADPFDNGLCADAIIPNSTPKTWDYTLHIPGYYTNYNDSQFNDDQSLKSIENQLIKVPGMVTINQNTVQDFSIFDYIKQKTLLIPTKFEKKAQGVDDAILGIANDINNRKINFNGLHQSVKDNFNVKSFNFYPDYFENKKQNKILYSNGKDLLKSQASSALNDNLFDTSSCDLVEFEIWGGGGQSRSNALSLTGSSVIVDYLNGSSQNNASSGQNGAYARGRFRIRANSLLKIKVADASGKASDMPNVTSDSINLDDDFSSISVTDSIDKDLNLVKAYSGSAQHECQINTQCANLKEETNLEKAINENQQLIIKDDNSRDSFKRKDNIKSLEKINFLDENKIAIDAYRNITMSSFSGVISDLFSSLPLSSPVTINRYIEDNDDKNNGYKIEKALVSLTKKTGSANWKDDGSGNFNEIGTYYYLGQLSSGISWINRSRYFDPKICKSKLESCHLASTAIKNTDLMANTSKFIYGGNASGAINIADSNYLTVMLSNSVQRNDLTTDFNLYCPGLGGCYFNNGKTDASGRFISQPGSAGLIKIRCLKI